MRRDPTTSISSTGKRRMMGCVFFLVTNPGRQHVARIVHVAGSRIDRWRGLKLGS